MKPETGSYLIETSSGHLVMVGKSTRIGDIDTFELTDLNNGQTYGATAGALAQNYRAATQAETEARRIRRIKLWGHWLQGWRATATQEPPKFALKQAVPVIDALEPLPPAEADKKAQEEGAAAARKLEEL